MSDERLFGLVFNPRDHHRRIFKSLADALVTRQRCAAAGWGA
jgi:hypothetical protein